jgi:PAS domain-containing protein
VLRTLRRERALTIHTARQWSPLSPEALSNLERGVTRQPPLETLERLLDALHQVAPVPLAQRNAVRDAWGYRPRFPLPTADEIAWAQQQWQAESAAIPYPAYLVDCAQRLLIWNDHARKLLGVPATDPLLARLQHVTIFDLAYDPTYGAISQVENRDSFLATLVYVLKCEFLPYRDEPWFAACIDAPRARYPAFRAQWDAIPQHALQPLGQRTMGPMIYHHRDGGRLCFRLLGAEFLGDPRFRGVQYIPLDSATMQQCLRWADDGSTEPRHRSGEAHAISERRAVPEQDSGGLQGGDGAG